jgi:hypothetical protein
MSATAPRTTCPVTRSEFRGNAKPLTASIAGQPVVVDVKEFSTGSMGWYAGSKITVDVAGKPVKVQVGITLTVIGSKELPQE